VRTDETDKLFQEVALDLVMSRSFDRLPVGVRGMDCKSTLRRALDVESEFQLSIVGGNLEAGKFRRQSGSDICLYFSLKFLASGRFKRRGRRIGCMGDESAPGLRLDAVGEVRDETLEVNLARL